jgi:hypothetical protein
MGNKSSTTGNTSDISKIRDRINIIATKYILGRKFNELTKLVSEKYCNDLMILTRDVLATNFTTEEIKYLASDASTSVTSESVMYISKQDFANIERATSNKKLLMCKGIAKFYIRIAHLFAAIATTVSPNWSSSSSSLGQVPGMGPVQGLAAPPPDAAQQMPKRGGQINNANASANANNETDFCSMRIRALLGATNSQSINNVVLVQPTVCSVYASKENPLARQPGMPDLEHLYNDIYDGATGRFSGKSIAMQNLYDSDLKKLYIAFTGESDMPSNIKTFDDIIIPSLSRYKECGPVIQTAKPAPVKDDTTAYRDQYRYNYDVDRDDSARREKLHRDKIRELQNEANTKEYYKTEQSNYSGIFTTQFKVAKNSGAYIAYGVHIKQMISNADRARAKLMQIIDKLFLVVESDAGRKNPIITIHPNLTYTGLDALINQTREMIINLYVGCERDFYKGLELLHVIIEEIMNANMKARLTALKSDTRKNIEKLEQDAMRTKDRSGSSKIYDTDPALLSTGDINRFEDYELHSQKKAQDAENDELQELNQANENAKTNSRPDLAVSSPAAVPDSVIPLVSSPAAVTAPAVPPAAVPPPVPVPPPAVPVPADTVSADPAVKPMIKTFKHDDELVIKYDPTIAPLKGALIKRGDSPKRKEVKFKGGRRI